MKNPSSSSQDQDNPNINIIELLRIARLSLLPDLFRFGEPGFEINEFLGDAVLEDRVSRLIQMRDRNLSSVDQKKLRICCVENRNLIRIFDQLQLFQNFFNDQERNDFEKKLKEIKRKFHSEKIPDKLKADFIESLLGELYEVIKSQCFSRKPFVDLIIDFNIVSQNENVRLAWLLLNSLIELIYACGENTYRELEKQQINSRLHQHPRSQSRDRAFNNQFMMKDYEIQPINIKQKGKSESPGCYKGKGSSQSPIEIDSPDSSHNSPKLLVQQYISPPPPPNAEYFQMVQQSINQSTNQPFAPQGPFITQPNPIQMNQFDQLLIKLKILLVHVICQEIPDNFGQNQQIQQQRETSLQIMMESIKQEDGFREGLENFLSRDENEILAILISKYNTLFNFQ
ncbi:MAG: hypothetical protein EZS28_029139 [Streblomastix strix]|uniref:RNase III domain-containing protein n=1 Tax=Streblomastix strix TaxID=222440 RepID=A0A5J4UZZ1_9EUKA|nr:MAG: hypothetical protein EZS28_029139 [Streblomastix strix]